MMRILQLTPGTGAFYCGGCLRDAALVRALRRRGHEVLLVPLYMPLVAERESEAGEAPIFLSGISVFLSRWVHVPRWLDRVLSAPWLLRVAARLARFTSAKDLGESALAMLEREPAELERLLEWLRGQQRFDVVCLSNSLLSGLARRLKQELGAPVVASLQGEDTFLDGLLEPYRSRCWERLAERCADVEVLVAPSRFYAELMLGRLRLTAEKVVVVHNGIELDGFEPAREPPRVPTVGFLARMHYGKGLDLLAEAFLQAGVSGARLRVAGAMTAADKPLVDALRRKLWGRVEFLPNISRTEKIAFLQGLSVMSVPTRYAEAFGLYVLEAWACGVPVVQPRHGAFPELVGTTGGGLLCEPNDARSLADALRQLLSDSARARELGLRGRAAVCAEFSAERMAERFEAVLAQVV